MAFPISEPREQLRRPQGGLHMRPRSTGNYTQQCNLAYGETDGVGLVMDVFQPTEGHNGHAIVDVISGAWRSDRIRLNEHIGLGAIDAFCAAGFTVFAVSPGSATLFTGHQMVEHVHAAIRHIRDQHDTWSIDSRPLGLSGASAGGHLAALAALQPEPGDGKARQSWYRHDTEVNAVGLFFPPSDFIDYGGQPFDFARGGEFALTRFLFEEGIGGQSPTEGVEAARTISPRHNIRGDHPPFFITHATGDAVVPYSQSERFAAALCAAGGEAHLATHQGPGHPWRTIGTECAKMAAWFEEKLVG